jgi:hypothetical protein
MILLILLECSTKNYIEDESIYFILFPSIKIVLISDLNFYQFHLINIVEYNNKLIVMSNRTCIC